MKRSKFNLSHTRLLSCDFGELVPCGLVEVLPGDSMQHGISALVRAAPLLAPVMHPVHVRVHCWFVPMRLLWSEWEDFITGGPAGTSVPTFPTISFGSGSTNTQVGTLYDYLGGATVTATAFATSALPFRAYQLIWNEWYRDQDLETEAVVSLASGSDTTTEKTLKKVAWEKDYFTSSRPWEQKGPAVTIPLGTTAPVQYSHANTTPWVSRKASDGSIDTSATDNLTSLVTSGFVQKNGSGQDIQFDPSGNLVTDLTGASSITVNLLREALALQRFEENRARYGSRYVEYLRYLGVRSSDARLQRPEYLGGIQQSIQFSEVLQTATGGGGVGDLFGHGIAGVRGRRYRRFFEEHGYVMCLLSIRPKTIYMNGLPRTWNRRVKEDFYQKELEHIGQQEVLNKEVYLAGASPDGVFGYQDRYDEYRRMESGVSGEFRSTLNFWHFARSFSSAPALNASFVSCVPPETPFSVPAEDAAYVMVRHNIAARRLLSKTGNSFIY